MSPLHRRPPRTPLSLTVTLLDKALPRFRDFFDEVLAATKTLRVQNTNTRYRAAVSLHCSALDQVRGILTLLESNDATCSFIILRSLLETVIDLFNLCADPQYEAVMRCNSLKESRTVLTHATQATASANPYFQAFTARPDLSRDSLENVCAELQQLADQGITPLKIYERFKRAKRLDLYQLPYAYLCLHSHHDINVVEERHLRRGGVAYFSAPQDEDVLLALDTAAGLLHQAVVSLHTLAADATPADLEGVTRKVEVLRELWSG
jgi:hypothetical protein